MKKLDKDMLWAIIRLAISLPLVIVLSFLFIKYCLVRRSFGMGLHRRMLLIEQLYLGPRTGLSLVQVGNCYFLLAFQEGKVTLVKEFAELPDELDISGQNGIRKKWYELKDFKISLKKLVKPS